MSSVPSFSSLRFLRQPTANEGPAKLTKKAVLDLRKVGIKAANPQIIEEHREHLYQLTEEEAALSVGERRYLTNDTTVEKLGELMNQNRRGLLLARDELSGWLLTMNKSGREGDRELYLEAWNGYGSFTVDRIGRGTLHIPAVCLSVVGGIQPGKLSAYVADATNGGVGDDGLFQRIQLLVYPDVKREWENVDRWPDTEARNRVFAIFRELDELNVGAKFGDDLDDSGDVVGLRFDDEGQDLFDAWRHDLEGRLRSVALESPAFESHLSKYRSLMPSLALLFHLIEIADGGAAGPVTAKCAWQAREWCSFLEGHAKRVYTIGAQTDAAAAQALAKRIRDRDITDGMTVRSIYRKGWAGLDRQAIEPGLSVLEDAGWCRVVEQKGDRGRATEIVQLNPRLTREVGQ